MCPVETAIIILGLASVAATTTTSVQQAQAQNESAKNQHKSIAAAEVIQQQQLAEREGQEREAADNRITQIQLDTDRAASLAYAMQSEAGVRGNSPRAQLRAIRTQGLRGVTAVERNEEWASRQLGYERQGVRSRASRQQMALNYGPGAAAAGIAGGLSGAATGLSLAQGVVAVDEYIT